MRIGTREIGPMEPPYIIAELGVNHDGDPERALELVRLAAGAGADAIKLQLFKADMLMSKAAKLAAYQKAAGETDPIEMLRRLELSIEEMEPCVALAHELGIHAIVSVFSVELVEVAGRLAWDAYKTASPDIINRPLLDALAATGKPLIVSTGASTLEEVERMVGWLGPIRERLAVLQCVSCYPTSIRDSALGGIRAIGGVFPGVVGYSDHMEGGESGAWAVRAGARVLEKHMTYDRAAKGPDHRASLEPGQFREYCEAARSRAMAHGELSMREDVLPVKGVLECERDVRAVSRQSLTAARDIPAGRVLVRSDLTIKRPGMGIPPYEMGAVIGKRAARAIGADMPLMPGDIG